MIEGKANITSVSNISVLDKIYDSTKTAYFNVDNASFSGKFLGDVLSVTGGIGGFSSNNVGTNISVTISSYILSGLDANNYNFNSNASSFTGSANITARNLILTALPQSKIYDGNTNVLNSNAFSVSGLATYENIDSVALSYNSKNVGVNKIISINNAVASKNTLLTNYNIQYNPNSNSEITAKNIQIIASYQTKTYDGNSNVSNPNAYTINGMVSNETINSVSLSFDNKNVASNKSIIISNAKSGPDTQLANYDITYVSNTTSEITPKFLKISALPQTKLYDGTNTVLNSSAYYVNGLVGNDQIDSVSLYFNNKNAATNKTIFVNNAKSHDNALLNNYQISYVNDSSSTISKLSLSSVSGITIQDKIYDGTLIANIDVANSRLTGVVSGDAVNIVGATAVFNNASIGDNKLVLVTNFSIAGLDALNYDVSNLSFRTYANILSPKNSTLNILSNPSYIASIKLNVPNYSVNPFESLLLNDIGQLGMPTFNSFVVQKKNNNKSNTIKITQSGVNKSLR